jgi:hypothetical protein
MTPQAIRSAIQAARLFQERAQAVLRTAHKLGGHEYVEVGAQSGALRRQSMELTRSLAVMRKGA